MKWTASSEFGTYRLCELAHTSSESRGTFRHQARSLAPLNGWACAVKICHDGMLEDTDSLDGGAQIIIKLVHENWWMKMSSKVRVKCDKDFHLNALILRLMVMLIDSNWPEHDKTNKLTCASSKDSGQPGHLSSLILSLHTLPEKRFGSLATHKMLSKDWSVRVNARLIWVYAECTGHFDVGSVSFYWVGAVINFLPGTTRL